MSVPTGRFYAAFGATYKTAEASLTWTELTDYVRQVDGVGTRRGRSSELDDFNAGRATLALNNMDRRFDPSHAAGPYFGDLLPGVPFKIEADFNPTPVTITSVLAEGTSANAAFYETTASFTPVAGRHYFVGVAWGSADTGDPATITSTTGLDFIPAACPGADGSCFARPSALRRVQHWIALADGTETSGKVRITVPAAVPEFSDLGIIVAEITNAHHGSAATDCLVQAGRVDTTSNGTSVGTFLHPFTDATNNKTLVFATNGGAHVMTAGADLTSLVQVSAGSLFRLGVFVQTSGSALEPATTWSTAASPSIVAYEVRAAGSATPSAFDAVPLIFNDDISVSSLTLASVPFTAGRPVLVGVVSGRTDGVNTPTSVTGATNAFTLVGSSTGFDTTGTPLRKIFAYLCANPTAVTEDVVVTWAGAQNSNGFAAVAIDLPAGATVSTVAQSDGDAADATTTLTGTLAAPTGGVLVLAGSDTIATGIVPATGSGLRMLFNSNGQSGNNGASWTSGSARKMAGFWRDTPAASVGATLETARDAGLLALEITPASTVSAGAQPVFRGFVDGWPQEYPDLSDNFAEVPLSVTDGFGKMARARLQPSPYASILHGLGPRRWFPLSDRAGTSAATDLGSSSQTARVSDGVTFGADNLDGVTTGAAFLDGEVVIGPAQTNIDPFATRSATFLVRTTTANGVIYSEGINGRDLLIQVVGGVIVLKDTGATVTASTRVDDGITHAVYVYHDNLSSVVYIDGTADAVTPVVTGGTFTSLGESMIGGPGSNEGTVGSFTGDLAHFAIHNTTLTGAQITSLYEALAQWDGDTADDRIGRIADEIGWPATQRDLEVCDTLLGAADTNKVALAVVKDVERTEQGRLFMDRAGKIRLLDRHWGITASTEGGSTQATLSDDGADIPYSGFAFDFDDRLVFGAAQGNRVGGQTITVGASVDSEDTDTSLTNLQLRTDDEVRGLLEYFLSRYSTPSQRIRPVKMLLHALTTAQQETLLALELGHRVVVERTPVALGAQIVATILVEGIAHDFTSAEWTMTLSFSPVDLHAYFILDTSELDGTDGLGF